MTSRLLEVLGGHASVALEKRPPVRGERREAEGAKALLEFSRELASAPGLDDVLERTVELAAGLLGSPQTSVWLDDPATGDLVCRSAWGATAREVIRRRYPGEVARRAIDRADVFPAHTAGPPGARSARSCTGTRC